MLSQTCRWMQKQCYHNYDIPFFLVSPFLWQFNFLKALGERLLLLARSSISVCLLTSLKSFKSFLKQDFLSQKPCLLFPNMSSLSRCPLIFTSLQLLCCRPQAFFKISVTFAIHWFSDIKGILSERFKTIFSPTEFLLFFSPFYTTTLLQ